MIKRFAFLIALLSTLIGFSQTNNTSPYSYFGIGDTNQQMTVASSSMGGINVAQSYFGELNFTNPAALTALQLTTFSIAGKLKVLQINDGLLTQNSSSTGLTSLALGVPFGKKGGLMVGLQPNSSVGYSISNEIYDGDEIIENYVFSGNGGTNRFFGSFAYEVIKGLSVGIEGEYIFGSINNNIVNIRKDVSFNSKYQTISSLKGASVKLGAQYQYKLENDLEVKLGSTIKLKNELKATSEEYLYSFLYGASGTEIPKDTITSNINLKGEINRPTAVILGAGLGKDNQWNVGVEYETQAAISIAESVFKNNKIQYTSKSRYSLGGFYIPKNNSLTNYWQRVIYRAGFKYEKTGLAVNGVVGSGGFTPINDFGISFGLGLPIGNQLSQVNLGLEYGNRGNTTNGLIKEKYFNLRLSFNLTDKWFRKNKIN
ncbi:MAG TPA: hypothetical protein EYG92_02860 [Lutibacter sp.]|nr:hypothetical protein [Lutibacter sp.]